MTDTIVATATLEHLDPTTLVIGDNIRSAEHVDVDQAFVESVKARGVLEPIIAYRHPVSGDIVVKAGQRRTIAAIKAELPTVPVYVHPTEPDTPDRIVDQWTENHQRQGMKLGDEIAAVDQLALFGVPAEQIATSLALEPEVVDTARKVGQSPAAKKRLAEDPMLTLEYAELLADVEATSNGDESAIAAVLEAAEKGTPAVHVRARYESAVAEAKAVEEFKAALGDTRVVERPEDGLPPEWMLLYNLKGVTQENHQGCPGRAVYITVRKGWRDEEPWNITAHEVCTAWKANGHEKVEYVGSAPTQKVKAADLPDEEREALKAERRRVVESNKAWKEATSVREKWLLGFGAIKKPLPGAESFIAKTFFTYVTLSPANLTDVGLNATTNGYGVSLKELDRASGPRALHIALCVVVSSIEHTLNDGAWRNQLAIAGPYLEALAKWGYGLSDIEKRIIADAKTEAKAKKS